VSSLTVDRAALKSAARAAIARQLLSCIRDATQVSRGLTVNASRALLLASQHLNHLSRLEPLLSDRANAAQAASEEPGFLRKLRVFAT
jgi:hypothetical protein